MEFKWMNTRAIILISIAGSLVFMTVISNFKSKSTDAANDQVQEPLAPVLKQQEAAIQPLNAVIVPDDEDEAVQEEMKAQMDRDRNQQRQIKMLKMQLEQINLQLENEKALTEINKLKKENTEYVKDSNSQVGTDFPNIRVVYIGGTDIEKEAILSIDGTSYSVKKKDKPVANVEILSVTDKGVKVHFSAPQELTTVINYIQD